MDNGVGWSKVWPKSQETMDSERIQSNQQAVAIIIRFFNFFHYKPTQTQKGESKLKGPFTLQRRPKAIRQRAINDHFPPPHSSNNHPWPWPYIHKSFFKPLSLSLSRQFSHSMPSHISTSPPAALKTPH